MCRVAVVRRGTRVSLQEQKLSREDGRALLVMLFVIYLALLTWIVLWKLQIPYLGWRGMRHIKLVPFPPTARAGASEPLEVAVNVLLFVPFGLYLTLLAPSWLGGRQRGQ